MLKKLFNKCIEINGIIKLLFYWSAHEPTQPVRPPARSAASPPPVPPAAAVVRERTRPPARSRVLLSTMLSRVDSKISIIRNGELLYK